ncbi:GNAT family N-acetyltransferase [Pediococcus pentosaceus]|uniref:GNAT family N-acetyltransferase n=1 Tax=Pediococcus pentosaceus TaxID=1255 RepID=UPI003982AF20
MKNLICDGLLRCVREENHEDTKEALANFFIPNLLTEWALTLKEADEVIGMLNIQDLSTYSASLGWVLNRTYWGHGYVPEAAAAILDLCFLDLQLVEVHAVHDIENIKSGRVMEKLGMHRRGRLPASLLSTTDGQRHLATVDYWSLTQDEYLQQPKE